MKKLALVLTGLSISSLALADANPTLRMKCMEKQGAEEHVLYEGPLTLGRVEIPSILDGQKPYHFSSASEACASKDMVAVRTEHKKTRTVKVKGKVPGKVPGKITKTKVVQEPVFEWQDVPVADPAQDQAQQGQAQQQQGKAKLPPRTERKQVQVGMRDKTVTYQEDGMVDGMVDGWVDKTEEYKEYTYDLRELPAPPVQVAPPCHQEQQAQGQEQGAPANQAQQQGQCSQEQGKMPAAPIPAPVCTGNLVKLDLQVSAAGFFHFDHADTDSMTKVGDKRTLDLTNHPHLIGHRAHMSCEVTYVSK